MELEKLHEERAIKIEEAEKQIRLLEGKLETEKEQGENYE